MSFVETDELINFFHSDFMFRLMVYSDTVLDQIHNRTIISDGRRRVDVIKRPKPLLPSETLAPQDTMHDWTRISCCIARQNCIERTSWASVKTDEVPLLNYSGLIVPLGKTDMHMYSYICMHAYIDTYNYTHEQIMCSFHNRTNLSLVYLDAICR